MKKVAIVGIGAVGSTTAYNIGLNELVDVIKIIDMNEGLAKAQAKDLQEGFIISGSKTRVEVSNYENMSDVDIVCITASVPATKVKDRLDFVKVNQKVITEITQSCIAAKFDGIFVLASNPVDIMTAVCQNVSGFSAERIIGSGTILDSARMISEIAQDLNIDPKYVTAGCVGEHGNSIVPVYSQVKIANQTLEEYLSENELGLDFADITQRIINGGYEIFNNKGATDFGIASALTRIIRAVLLDTNEKLLVTSQTTIGAIKDVYLPVEAKVGKNGVIKNMQLNLDAVEYIELEKSANLMKEYQNSVLN